MQNGSVAWCIFIATYCMSSGISNADAPNKFYDWCRKQGKTAIVVDHQGKKGDTAYGTMGKEIALDAVLQLKSSRCATEVIVTKNRNFESNDPCWVRYSIKSESSSLAFQPTDKTGKDEGMKVCLYETDAGLLVTE